VVRRSVPGGRATGRWRSTDRHLVVRRSVPGGRATGRQGRRDPANGMARWRERLAERGLTGILVTVDIASPRRARGRSRGRARSSRRSVGRRSRRPRRGASRRRASRARELGDRCSGATCSAITIDDPGTPDRTDSIQHPAAWSRAPRQRPSCKSSIVGRCARQGNHDATIAHIYPHRSRSASVRPACGQRAASVRPACGQRAASVRPACGQRAASVRPACGQCAASVRPV